MSSRLKVCSITCTWAATSAWLRERHGWDVAPDAFVFSATLIYGILAALTSQFFLDVGWPPASVWLGGILHAAINGLCAPWAAAAVRLLGVWAGDEDGVSRALPIESARRTV